VKILVTGGAGFIGSNIVDAYIAAGHDVVVVDDLSSGKRENVNPRAIFYECDIRSGDIKKIFADERPDVVNHHAAQISVPQSVKDPCLDASVNVTGLLNILDAAAAVSIKKFIFISSGGAIYGEAKEYPTSEASKIMPVSPYAVTKALGEMYTAFYGKHRGVGYTILRYANVYGPRQIPHGEAGVVAIFMNNLIEGKPSMLCRFKEELRGMTRDYVYVADVAAANVAALTKGNGMVLNIGTGIATHTRELYDTVYGAVKGKRAGLDAALANPGFAAARDGDLRRSCLDVKAAEKEIGWKAATALVDGVAVTLKWRLK